MARVTPDEAAAAWASRLGQSTAKIQQGVSRVTVAPGQAAARQKAVWLNNVTAKADKWAANVSRVTLADWQQSMETKGVQRIASGAQAAQPKMQAFMTSFLPYLDNVKASLPPRGDLQANINRMVQQVQKTAQYKR